MSMFKDPNYTIVSLIGSLSYFQFDYLNPILSLRLFDLGLSQFSIGLFFTISAILYTLSSVLIPFLPKIVDKKI